MTEETIVVNTNYGPVRGRVRKSDISGQFYSFQSIPYAKPPIGELRFKDPQPPPKWTDELDATKEGAPCPAPMDLNFSTTVPGASENCLFINAYTKEINPTVKRPVMVMIHGGGFSMGSSSEFFQGPENLLKKDIVYFSMNYRLGVFGFMSVPDKKHNIPGNAGLKDQTLSLRWVRENCHHFGGDPENITIFGISAGGASVHYHLISEHSRGLFDKAIVQSGSGLNAWANRGNTNELTIRVAKSLGWDGEGGIDDAVKILQSASTEDLAAKQYLINEEERQRGEWFGFVPCVEPYDNGVESTFLPKSIPELMKTAWGNKIPIIIGATSEEGYLNYSVYKANDKMFDHNGYFVNAVPRVLRETIADNPEKLNELGEKIKKFFYKNEKPTIEEYDKYIPILSDILFWHGVYVATKARLADPKSAPTYLYRFNYNSDVLTAFKLMFIGAPVKGCVHGEDMLYIFKILGFNDGIVKGGPDERISNIFINAWTEFALNGNPKCKELEGVDWKPLVAGSGPYKCLNINQELEFIDLPETERMNFWDSIHNFGFEN